MNSKKLTAFDRAAIKEIFTNARMEFGVIERLFATPVSFVDDEGKVQFRFPVWRNSVCNYLQKHYSKAETLVFIQELMAECMLKGNYQIIPNFQSEVNQTNIEEPFNQPQKATYKIRLSA